MKHWPKTANFLIVPICHGCFSKKYLSLKINEVVLTNRVNQSTLTKIGPYMKKMRFQNNTSKKKYTFRMRKFNAILKFHQPYQNHHQMRVSHKSDFLSLHELQYNLLGTRFHQI